MPEITKQRILFLAATPRGTEGLTTLKEANAIEETLKKTTYRNNIELVSRAALEPKALLELMRNYQAVVVHFSGHGAHNSGSVATRNLSAEQAEAREAGGLVLEDEDGEIAFLEVSKAMALFQMLKQQDHPVICVVLNACYTYQSLAKKLTGNNGSEQPLVSFVVGMNAAVLDGAAREFSKGFYQALGEGNSLKDAFEAGKWLASLIDDSDQPRLEVAQGKDPAEFFLIPRPEFVLEQDTDSGPAIELPRATVDLLLEEVAQLVQDGNPNAASQRLKVALAQQSFSDEELIHLRSSLAWSLEQAGLLHEAQHEQDRVLTLAEKTWGRWSRGTLHMMRSLAQLLLKQQCFSLASVILHTALLLSLKHYGQIDPLSLKLMERYSALLDSRGDTERHAQLRAFYDALQEFINLDSDDVLVHHATINRRTALVERIEGLKDNLGWLFFESPSI